MDHGTENSVIAKMHIAFRMHHEDSLAGSKSFMYGPSTANIVCRYFKVKNVGFILETF